MENVFVCAFTDEQKAFDAWAKINELEGMGDVNIYRKVLLRVDNNGTPSVVTGKDAKSGWATLSGFSVGTLVGMLGGPLGMVVGSVWGTALGSKDELDRYNVSVDFIDTVKSRMKNGTYTVICDLEDYDMNILESYMKQFDGTIEKTKIADIYNNYYQKVMAQEESDIQQLEKELNTASAEKKEEIRKKLDARKQKRAERKKQLQDSWNRYKDEQQQRLDRLDEKITKATDAQKEKFRKLKTEMTNAWNEKSDRFNNWLNKAA